MKRVLMLACVTVCSASHGLETRPWFGNPYEFNFQGAWLYSRFHRVEGASRQLSAPLNDRDILLDLGLTASQNFDIQVEGEFGKTNHVNWAFRSAAVQARLGILDDISGDPFSLVTGLTLRGAPHHFLRDVSTPYAAEFNAELTCAVGKEWSDGTNWTMRTWGLAALGQANRGYPWTRGILGWEYNLNDVHCFTAFAEGNVGFGPKKHVNVRHFNGWAQFQHRSIDLGGAYGYTLSVYGTLTASYAYRVFAHCYPEHVNFFMLAFSVPFSLF